MNTKVNPIPEGYHTITPYLIIKGAADAIEFYKKAFNAKELFRMPKPDGRIGHAEIKIGDSLIMLADEFPEMDALSPTTIGNTATSFMLYVEDVDAIAKQAIAAGAHVLKPVADQFYGDRNGMFADPFGHKWCIGTRKENLTEEEIAKRFEEMVKQNKH